MKLSTFINDNIEPIVAEWETFASTLLPAAKTLTPVALRDHFHGILKRIAADIEALAEPGHAAKESTIALASRHDAAAEHGTVRHAAGFELHQVSAEFHALRDNILRTWIAHDFAKDEQAFTQMLRFNDAVDKAMADSLARYAEEVERSRNMFLAILGHDLRTPLSAIIMTSQYLATPGIAQDRLNEAAERLGRSAAAMSAMIKDLLEFTRSRLGKGIPVLPAPCDLGKVCASALEQIREAHPNRQFDLEVSGPLDCVIDGERIGQVLWNLLNNAVQYGARNLPVDISAQSDADDITVQVRNHGPAIPAETLQVIFNPMIHVGDDSDDSLMPPANLGLGLFIAREIVHAHHGEISATSSDKEGTVFTFTLPRSKK